MQIESSNGSNCVNRAFSTARACLGLNPTLQHKMKYDHTEVRDVAKESGLIFPECNVYIWCEKEHFVDCELNVHFCGSNYFNDFDDSEYVIMFSYFIKGAEAGHMVIGQPALYENMISSICIAIKLRENSKKQKEID